MVVIMITLKYFLIYFNIFCYDFEYTINDQCERLVLQFRQTSEVFVKHNIDSWQTTHKCENPTIIVFGEPPDV